MKKAMQVFLGVLTALGGFVDIGELVAASQIGSRFKMSLAWPVVLSTVVIISFAEMSGRVAAVAKRPVFDIVRERLSPGLSLINLVSSFVVTALTLAAEIGGVALSIQLATSVNYLLWIPMVAFLVWFVIWKVGFDAMENIFGILGLALVVVAVAVWKLHPDFGRLAHQILLPSIPSEEGATRYWYFAVAMFGAGVMPYEVFFFSSGAIEEGWSKKDLGIEKANVFIGFPLGALLTLSLMAAATVVLSPQKIQADSLYQTALAPSLAFGKLGLALALMGFFACTFGAALETALSCGYMVGQYFGWPWGKALPPRQGSRFHLVVLLSIIGGMGLVLTTLNPIKLTEVVLVLSAVALPLTFFPILVIANDPQFMGDKINSPWTNGLATTFLIITTAVSVVALPLMIASKGGG